VFRAYDIRGIAGRDFDAKGAEVIGRSFIEYLLNKGVAAKNIVIAMDGRVTSLGLKKAIVSGITSVGSNVVDLGYAMTPMLYFAVCHGKYDAGIMITASHNPRQYNGFKLCGKNAESVCGDELQKLKKICKINNKQHIKENIEDFGEVFEKDFFNDLLFEYEKKLSETVCMTNNEKISDLKIVVDAGNGIAGKFVPKILENIGVNVVRLFCEVDGVFPNREPNPDNPKELVALREKVINTGANFGVAFDGDGDRLAIIDENGDYVNSDMILILLARIYKKEYENKKKSPIVVDVKISQLFLDEAKKLDLEVDMTKTGHSFIERRISEINADLGGEASGHFFFAGNYYGFDDATLALLKVLKFFIDSGENNFSNLFSSLPKIISSPEIRLACDDNKKFTVLKKIVNYFSTKHECITIDGIRMNFENGAWAAIRASNTSPNLTMRIEAKTRDEYNTIRKELKDHLRIYAEIGKLDF